VKGSPVKGSPVKGSLAVLEAEDELAAHQTGHNSGVIHSGLYYRPGSLKARNCSEGRDAMYRFCEEHQIAHERCGKIVVATSQRNFRPDELERRAMPAGSGMKRIKRRMRDYEPMPPALKGSMPVTGIVDYVEVTKKYAEIVRLGKRV
jgi:L-2-hydroxyglutarate oxidase